MTLHLRSWEKYGEMYRLQYGQVAGLHFSGGKVVVCKLLTVVG